MKWSHSRPWGFLTIVHMFEYCLLLVKNSYNLLKRVLNLWDYIDYVCSPINITKVCKIQLSASLLVLRVYDYEHEQTPAVRGIFCLNLKCF